MYAILPEQDIAERYTGKTVKIGDTTIDEEAVTYIKEGATPLICPTT